MQSEAWKKHVQASAAYEKSNDIKYGIYKKYLNHFWKEHEGQEANFINAKMLEEQARDNFAQAAVYRRNTRHMNLGSVKVEKLTEANNLEAAAIRRQVASLSSCFGAAAATCVNCSSPTVFPKALFRIQQASRRLHQRRPNSCSGCSGCSTGCCASSRLFLMKRTEIIPGCKGFFLQ